MRLNRKCRRTLRDERAGLCFTWRLPERSLVRTVLALALTGGLFAGGAAFLEVKGKGAHSVRTEPVRLRILDPDAKGARAVLDWARRNSPFSDRWEPNTASALGEAMAVLESELTSRTQYHPLLRQLPKPADRTTLPELFSLTRPRLPVPTGEPRMERVAPSPRGEVCVMTEASGPLKDRWDAPVRPLRELLLAPGAGENLILPEEMVGTERVFLVGGDPSGGIGFCRSMEHADNKLDEPLAQWLRQLRLKPDPQTRGMVWGKIRVSVRRVGDAIPGNSVEGAP